MSLGLCPHIAKERRPLIIRNVMSVQHSILIHRPADHRTLTLMLGADRTIIHRNLLRSLLVRQELPGVVFHAPHHVIVLIPCAVFLAEMRMVEIVEMVGMMGLCENRRKADSGLGDEDADNQKGRGQY
jgi:hypothetical protein